jgi:hypothetical protein
MNDDTNMQNSTTVLIQKIILYQIGIFRTLIEIENAELCRFRRACESLHKTSKKKLKNENKISQQ